MEKCTYCVQRINDKKIKAKNAGNILKEGDVVTACQQACPTNAIVFGNLNNPESQVVKKKQLARNYEMLAELNIKPRTSYLAKIRNPHPDLNET
jgi:molybdopterin-containing oxidoreductase family iron-sulfur binding subunit